MFKKLQHFDLANTKPGRLFPLLSVHIASQVELESSYTPDLESLSAMPIEAQTVYWLWRFLCEAEGSLIDGFLLQGQGIFTPQVHAALRQIGEDRLIERLEAGIPLAVAGGGAEFAKARLDPWYQQFKVRPGFRNWRAVNKGCYPVLFKKFRERVHEYILEHKAILME